MENISYYLGNLVIVIIIVLSIISFAIIVEKLFIFFQFSFFERNILKVKEGKIKNISELDFSDEQVFKSFYQIMEIIGNKTIKFKKDILNMKLDSFLEVVDSFLEKRLLILRITAVICPTLGILGTVFGMISAFDGFMTEDYKKDIFIKGILQALYSTALGLSISIVCVVFYNFFLKKIDMKKVKIYYNIKEMIYEENENV